MGQRDPKDVMYEGTTHEPRQEDITAWRMKLRERDYLNPGVSNDSRFESLSGTELSDELLNMTDVGMRRRRYNMDKIFKPNDESGEEPPDPIFVTESERSEFDDIANKTKEKIKDIVQAMLPQIDSDSTRHELEEDWRQIQKKNKPFLVKFYYNVCELIAMQGVFVPITGSESDSESD